jgi:hypothetical protein
MILQFGSCWRRPPAGATCRLSTHHGTTYLKRPAAFFVFPSLSRYLLAVLPLVLYFRLRAWPIALLRCVAAYAYVWRTAIIAIGQFYTVYFPQQTIIISDSLASGRTIRDVSVGCYPPSDRASTPTCWTCERAPRQHARSAAITQLAAFHAHPNMCNTRFNYFWKHSYATATTYRRRQMKHSKHGFKTLEIHCKPMQHFDETLATDVWKHMKHLKYTLTTCTYM